MKNDKHNRNCFKQFTGNSVRISPRDFSDKGIDYRYNSMVSYTIYNFLSGNNTDRRLGKRSNIKETTKLVSNNFCWLFYGSALDWFADLLYSSNTILDRINVKIKMEV